MAALLLLAASPPVAAAYDGTAAPAMQFAFESHSGYWVRVFATRSAISLTTEAREGPGYAETLTDYIARAQIDGDRVSADFGDLGRISMRFVPSSASPSTECEGRRRVRAQHGKFVGSLRFSGEGGYLGVDVRQARGVTLTPLPRLSCNPAKAPVGEGNPIGKPKHKLASLYAGFRRGVRAVHFGAYRTAGRAFYEVTDESGGEQVATDRYAYVEASPLTFATDSALSFAAVSPPAPFSGSGAIQRNPDGSRVWSGTLAVSFPGDPNVSLTGPQFRTELLREW